MVIEVREHTPQCNTFEDGLPISALILERFREGEDVVLSFAGVREVPSSFINGALLTLLDEFDFGFIRTRLKIEDSNRQINDMIKRCFSAAHKRTPPLTAECA